MKVYQTSEIKNIALVGGAKSGKTTLAEAMSFEAGVITRRGSVDEKTQYLIIETLKLIGKILSFQYLVCRT